MKFLLITLLVPYILSAQVAKIDSTEEESDVQGVPEELTHDISVLALSISYAKRMHEYWLWGVGGGGGFDILNSNIWNSSKSTVEYFHGELFVRYKSSDYWELDLGGRASYVGYFSNLFDGGIQRKGSFFGGYTSALVGFRNFKVGARVIFGSFTNMSWRGPNFSAILFPMMRVTVP